MQPNQTPGKLGKNATSLIAVAVATVALLLSAAALVVATLALANSRKNTTASSMPQLVTTPPGPTQPAPTGTRSEEVPSGPDRTTNIDPGSVFTIAYQREHLRATTPNCVGSFDTTGIDFDEPRADADSSLDAQYEGCSPGTISTRLPVAKVSSGSATPKDCLEQIRTQPEVSPLTPASGLTFCFVTDKGTAAQEGVTQKIVFLTVDSLSSANNHGILNFTLTAHNVP